MNTENRKKADKCPPVVFFGSAVKDIPIFDPRKDDYAAFVKQVSS